MTQQLTIKTFSLGAWQTNCYVVHRRLDLPDASRNCWIIDCGYHPQELLAYVENNRLKPSQIVLTHAHLDHIAGLEMARAKWAQIPILIHEAEEKFLTDPVLNLSVLTTDHLVAPKATALLKHGQTLDLDGLRFEIRHTPGHSPGGISLYQPAEKIVFTGDSLFAGSVGRYDFPTSDPAALFKGIATQLMTLPDDTDVFPGHGDATTIGEERENNPYL
jgi:glyoxylase-like metal-dependent hydrolase (beta-lactamase superfamily II)